MKNVIAYSLWGNDPKYVEGVRENIQLAKQFYPDWEVWVYTDIPSTSKEKHVLIRTIERPKGWEGTFWRFWAPVGCDRAIFRDADSRLGPKEAAAVKEWVEEGTKFHVMRDHQDHKFWPILAGMWGMKGCGADLYEKWVSDLQSWPQNPADKLNDQKFLAAKVWPQAIGNITHHSSVDTPHIPYKPFPEVEQSGFVGEIIDVSV